jgi:hypothetical protein
MERVEPKKIIRNLYRKYAIIDGNLIDADKLFVINTVINYIFKDKDYRSINTKELAEYGELINRYLKEEVDIYWEDDRLLVEELAPVGEQTSGE